MKHFLTSFLFVVISLFGISGCATIKMGGVVVSVADIKPADPSPQGMMATLTIDYANENVVSIGISQGIHKLYLNDTYVGSSVNVDPIGLPQMATSKQSVPFHIEKADYVRKLAAGASNHAVPYRIVTHLRSYSGEDKVEFNTANTGMIDLSPLVSAK
ncbi:MAG: LEA type 2 family protein [Opitutaceae bacterium]|jgi:LEA14-like dessication related protein